MPWQRCQEIHYGVIVPGDQECVIPQVCDMLLGNRLDVSEIHHHAVLSRAIVVDDAAGQGDLDYVAMPVEMPALTTMVWNAVAGIEFEAAGDLHGNGAMLDGQAL